MTPSEVKAIPVGSVVVCKGRAERQYDELGRTVWDEVSCEPFVAVWLGWTMLMTGRYMPRQYQHEEGYYEPAWFDADGHVTGGWVVELSGVRYRKPFRVLARSVQEVAA